MTTFLLISCSNRKFYDRLNSSIIDHGIRHLSLASMSIMALMARYYNIQQYLKWKDTLFILTASLAAWESNEIHYNVNQAIEMVKEHLPPWWPLYIGTSTPTAPIQACSMQCCQLGYCALQVTSRAPPVILTLQPVTGENLAIDAHIDWRSINVIPGLQRQ